MEWFRVWSFQVKVVVFGFGVPSFSWGSEGTLQTPTPSDLNLRYAVITGGARELKTLICAAEPRVRLRMPVIFERRYVGCGPWALIRFLQFLVRGCTLSN